MVFHFKKYISSIVGFIALFAFVLLPDVIFGVVNPAFETSATGKNIFIAALIALFFNFSASRITTVFVLTMCFLMQATQLAHFYHFGTLYSAFDIASLFEEAPELFASVTDLFKLLAIPVALSFVFYVIALVVHLKLFKKTPKLPFLSVLFVIALLVPFLQALSGDTAQKFQANETHLSIKNSLYGMSYFAANEVKALLDITEETSK